MARVMWFRYFCDNWKDAGHEPQAVEGDTVLVYSPKQGQVVELDICDPCLAGLNLPGITALADTLGREIAEPEIDPGLVCPYGCQNSEPFKNKGGLTRHLTRKHPEHHQG